MEFNDSVHGKFFFEKTVRTVFKDGEKIRASKNLVQISIGKNLRMTDEIQFLNVLDTKLADLYEFADINYQIIETVIMDLMDTEDFEYSRHSRQLWARDSKKL